MSLPSSALLELIAQNVMGTHVPHREAWDTWLALVDRNHITWSDQALVEVLETWSNARRKGFLFVNTPEATQLRRDMESKLLARTSLQGLDVEKTWALAVELNLTELQRDLEEHPSWPTIDIVSGWRLKPLEVDRRSSKDKATTLVHDLLDRRFNEIFLHLLAQGLPLPKDALNWATVTTFEALIKAGAVAHPNTLEVWSRRFQDNRIHREEWESLQTQLKQWQPLDQAAEQAGLTQGLNAALRRPNLKWSDVAGHLNQLKTCSNEVAALTMDAHLPNGQLATIPVIGVMALAKLRHHESSQCAGKLFSEFMELVKSLPQLNLDPNQQFGGLRLGSLLKLANLAHLTQNTVHVKKLSEILSNWDPELSELACVRMMETYTHLMQDRSSDRRLAIDIQVRSAFHYLVPFSDVNLSSYREVRFKVSQDFVAQLLATPSFYQSSMWHLWEKSIVRHPDHQALMAKWLNRPSILNSPSALLIAGAKLEETNLAALVESIIVKALKAEALKGTWTFKQLTTDSYFQEIWSAFKASHPKKAEDLLHVLQSADRLKTLEKVAAPAPPRHRFRG